MSNTDTENQITQQIGERIKQARKEAALSQKELGDALMLSDKAVSAYEVGRAQPSLETLQKLSRITHKPISYFVDESDPDDFDLQIRIRKIENELLEIKKVLKKR